MATKSGTIDPAQLSSPAVKWDRQTLVTKSAPIRYEITTGTDGQRTDTWFASGCQATFYPGQKDPAMVMKGANIRARGGDTTYSDYSKSDFKGFDWVAKGNYIGIQTLAGHACYVFQSPVDPKLAAATAANPGAPAVIPASGNIAFIAPYPSAPTVRVPILLKTDEGVTFYQWGSPPPGPLSLPASVQSFVSMMEAREKAATGPPAIP